MTRDQSASGRDDDDESLYNAVENQMEGAASASPTPGTASRYAFDKVRAGLMLLTIAALSLMMSVHLRQDRAALELNKPSPREVRASRSVIYADSDKTASLKQVAMDAARPVYDMDEHAATKAHDTVQEIFGKSGRRSLYPPPPRRSEIQCRPFQYATYHPGQYRCAGDARAAVGDPA